MEQLKRIQSKIGVKPDGVFGPNTAKAIVSFLKLNIVEGSNFLGQTGHESEGFKRFVENMNYSEERLLKIYPKYFTTEDARKRAIEMGKVDNRAFASVYANKPEMIGNLVYANRLGNGSIESGDGYRHRGQGLIQTTGKYNQFEFADFIGDHRIKQDPGIIGREYALESADFFFRKKGIYKLCVDLKEETIMRVSIAVNGGRNGLEDRIEKTLLSFRWLMSKS